MTEASQKSLLNLQTKAESKKALWTNIKKGHTRHTMDKDDNLKILKAKIGNLEVQVSEYQQIVKELTEKLQAYNQKMGSVFVKSNTDRNN